MKRLLYILLLLPITLFGQKITVTVKPIVSGESSTYLAIANSKIAYAEWFGLSVNNTPAENYTIIQNLVNNTAYNTVIVGRDTTQVFLISQPILLRSNMTFTVDGYLKIKDGSQTFLTSDVGTSTTVIPVVSSTGFAAGEWVSVSDTSQTVYYAKDYGVTSKIESIDGNNITLSTSTGVFSYTTAKAAYLGHTQSVIIAEECKNVTINGTGIIDGNQANQSQINGLINGSVFQETRNGCGLVILHCDNVVIDGLTFKNGLLHNININGNNGTTATFCNNIRVNNVHSYSAHDKNCHVRYVKQVWVTNSIFENALYEDGLIFYVHCYNAFVDNVITRNNPRAGIYWNSQYDSCFTATNLQTSGNLYGIYLTSRRVNISNVISTDNIYISNAYDARDINLSNIQIVGSSSEFQIYIGGSVERVNFSNLTIRSCTGIAIKTQTLSLGTPTAILISGGGIYDHTGTTTDIAGGTGITWSNFTGSP